MFGRDLNIWQVLLEDHEWDETGTQPYNETMAHSNDKGSADAVGGTFAR
jgi:hypothetical protein